MLVKEYRIPLPLSVEEYRVAQLYMIAVSCLTLFHFAAACRVFMCVMRRAVCAVNHIFATRHTEAYLHNQ